MILPDTSVWIHHFRRPIPALLFHLENGDVMCHPFVIGELACGSLKDRDQTIQLLEALESAPVAHHQEVLALLNRYRLMGTGIGWVDAHLLASTLLADASLWTLDGPLARAAETLSVHVRR